MSMSDFGRHLGNVIRIKVAYQLLHLIVINIPFLGVRIYLWYTKCKMNVMYFLLKTVFILFSIRAAFNYELSLFVVKNLCYIFMLLHSLYPGNLSRSFL